MRVNLTINGQRRADEVEPRMLLVHYLREVAQLTGTHVGCETSMCGACTVHLGGQAVKSCTIFAVQAEGAEITDDRRPRQGRPAPSDAGRILGRARPPMRILHARHDHVGDRLLQHNPNPTEEEIRVALEGNLCRCTGYQHIVKAVQYAANKMRASKASLTRRRGHYDASHS